MGGENNQGRSGDGGDGGGVDSDVAQGLEVLDQCVGSLGRGAHGGDQLIAPLGVGVRVGVVDRDLDTDTGSGVALVRQRGRPHRRRPVQRWQGVGACGGDVR